MHVLIFDVKTAPQEKLTTFYISFTILLVQ